MDERSEARQVPEIDTNLIAAAGKKMTGANSHKVLNRIDVYCWSVRVLQLYIKNKHWEKFDEAMPNHLRLKEALERFSVSGNPNHLDTTTY